MRSKNLYLINLDVYTAAVSLSPMALKSAKLWQGNQDGKTISDAILEPVDNAAQRLEPVVCITLRFARAFPSIALQGAFNEILAGLPSDVIKEFTNEVGKAIGQSGVQQGDDILFVWMRGGGLKFVRNGQVSG